MNELERLNAPTARQRLDEARAIAASTDFPTPEYDDVNGHIHTTFSFSPYSPTAAVYKAKLSGLNTAGIMDHDSVGGAAEFVEAGRIFDLLVTVGLECRTSLSGTPYADALVNNPDQRGCAYTSIHGIPHDRIADVDAVFAPLRARRNERNIAMTARINERFGALGIRLDFERDVLPLSQYAGGGSVTERHLSLALANAIVGAAGRGGVVPFLGRMGVSPSDKLRGYLSDESNPHFMYDLIGLIKSHVISGFYIPATDELLPVRDAIALADEVGAISCMPYLGDVGDSVTGDKKAQKFEDDYLDDWIAYCRELGFRAITYMPSRNTPAQLERLRALIRKNGLWEISGEDINTSRQSFVCPAMRDARFDALRTNAYALIAHERRAENCPQDGLFGENSARQWPDMDERVAAFAAMVRNNG